MDAPSLIEDIRFGYGPKAGTTPSAGGLNPDRLLAQLTATDAASDPWIRPPLADRQGMIAQFRADKMAGLPGKNASTEADMAGVGMQLTGIERQDVQTFASRPAVTDVGFVERLVNLWANRITVSNFSQNVGHFIQSFRDEAIRPTIGARYADMLKATIYHPAMQIYLTQVGSIGPNSPIGLAKHKGLNENLAREFLELHTMGHGYTQTDVTEFAKLLAGMVTTATGPRVDQKRAEPGRKTILGARYGEGLPEIDRFIETVAHRPETANAVAFFLARHFIADTPPPDLVAVLSQSYLANDTQLVPVYRTLLEHPAAADPVRQKVRSPQEYVVATLRLMGLTGQEANMPGFKKQSMTLPDALTKMGQPPYRPQRPDG